MDELLATLRTTLLPIEGAPNPRPPFRASAVLLLIFPGPRGPRTILTVRSSAVRHAGQVSLPGGAVENDDLTPWDTAVRETHEELGIPPELVLPLGRLPEVHVGASGYHIVPYVGTMDLPPQVVPHDREVERAVEIEIIDLLDPSSVRAEEWVLRGRPCLVSYFAVGGLQVWGATGRILSQFALCAGAAFPSRLYLPGTVEIRASNS